MPRTTARRCQSELTGRELRKDQRAQAAGCSGWSHRGRSSIRQSASPRRRAGWPAPIAGPREAGAGLTTKSDVGCAVVQPDRRLGALGRCVNHCRGCPQIIPFCVRGAERPMTFTAAAGSTGGVGGRRRRSDKVAACVMVLLMAVFSIGAPVLSVVAARGAVTPPPRCGPRGPGVRCLPSCCRPHRRPRPLPTRFSATPWSRAGGPRRTVGGGPAGSGSVPAWPLAARLGYGWRQRGRWPALRPATVRGWPTSALAAAVAPVVLGIVLWWLAWAGRWVLDRRRLADWEAAWSAVGPQWTQRFWSQGQP